MTDFLVTMESAWVLRDVRSLDDAIGIAIAEAGKRLNPAAKYVEVEAGLMGCPYCDESLSCALVIANTALVGLLLEMRVFKAESEEHARRIALSVVGRALARAPSPRNRFGLSLGAPELVGHLFHLHVAVRVAAETGRFRGTWSPRDGCRSSSDHGRSVSRA